MENCSIRSSLLQFIPQRVPFASILIIFSPITVILNLALIASFIATRQVSQNTSTLLIFLTSIFDITSGLIFMPVAASILLDIAAEDLCLKLKIFLIGGGWGNFSALLTVLIAIDRYHHMDPEFHIRQSKLRKILTMPYLFYLLLIAFIFSMLFSVIGVLIGYEHRIANAVIGLISTSFMTICILVVAVLYTRGYLRIRKFTDNNAVYCASEQTPDYVRSLYKTVLILVLLVCVHYGPFCVLGQVMTISYISSMTFQSKMVAYVYEFAILLLYAGTFTNCSVVLYFNRKAKDWILRLIGLRS